METVFTVERRTFTGSRILGYYDSQVDAESSVNYRSDSGSIVRSYRYNPESDSVLTACRCYATGSTVAYHAEKYATLD